MLGKIRGASPLDYYVGSSGKYYVAIKVAISNVSWALYPGLSHPSVCHFNAVLMLGKAW